MLPPNQMNNLNTLSKCLHRFSRYYIPEKAIEQIALRKLVRQPEKGKAKFKIAMKRVLWWWCGMMCLARSPRAVRRAHCPVPTTRPWKIVEQLLYFNGGIEVTAEGEAQATYSCSKSNI